MEAVWRADDRVVADRIVARVVEVVRPVVEFLGPWLDGSAPISTALDVGNTAGPQHSHQFIGRDVAEVFTDQQRD